MQWKTNEPSCKVVLIVEDDFRVRWLASAYLRTVGFRVIEAATANEAIAVLSSRTKVHIIFSDITYALAEIQRRVQEMIARN